MKVKEPIAVNGGDNWYCPECGHFNPINRIACDSCTYEMPPTYVRDNYDSVDIIPDQDGEFTVHACKDTDCTDLYEGR